MATKRTAVEILLALKDKVSGPLRTIRDQAERAKNKTKQLRESLDNVAAAGKKIAALGAAMTLLALGAGKAFADVETAAVPLRTVVESTMGGVEASMTEAYRQARYWSDNHVQSMAKWLDMAYKVAGAGLSDAATFAATSRAAALATTSLADNADAANLLTDAYLNFGNRAANVNEEMGRLADWLLVTQQKFKFENLGVLRESMKLAAAGAKTYNVELDQTLSVLGALNSTALAGSMAGTAFSGSLRTMSKAAKQLGFEIARTDSGALDYIGTLKNIRAKYGDIGKASQEVQDKFQQAFGDEGLRAISLLLDKVDTLDTHMGRLGEAGGAVDQTLKLMESVPNARWEIFKNQARNIARDIGEQMRPNIEQLMGSLEGATGRLGEFVKQHPGVGKMATAIAAMGAAMTIAGAAAWGLSVALSAVLAHPVAAAIVAIIGGIVLLVMYFEEIKAFFQNFPTWVIIALVAVGTILTGGLLPIVIGAAVLIIKYWDQVKAFFTTTLPKLWHWMKMGWWQFKANMLKAFSEIVIGVSDKIFELVLWIDGAGRRLVDAFVKGIKAGWSTAVETIKKLLGKIKDFFTQSDAKVGPLKNLTYMGSMLPRTFARGMEQGEGDLEAAAERMARRARPLRFVGGNTIGAINLSVRGGGDDLEYQVERALDRVLRRHSYEMGG